MTIREWIRGLRDSAEEARCQGTPSARAYREADDAFRARHGCDDVLVFLMRAEDWERAGLIG